MHWNKHLRKFQVTLYSGYDRFRQQLKELGVEFTERYTFGSFYGIEFSTDKPRGKGATKKIDALYHILDKG